MFKHGLYKHGLYKHENCSDIAAQVLRIVHVPEKYGYKVKVSWVNVVNPENHYAVNISEEIFLDYKSIKAWKRIA